MCLIFLLTFALAVLHCFEIVFVSTAPTVNKHLALSAA